METVEEVIARKRKEREEENLAALKRDIERAREALLKRYRRYVDEELTPSGLFNSTPYYIVEFPDLDTATATPVKFGFPMNGVQIEFRLSWERGRMFWSGNFGIRKAIFEEEDPLSFFAGLAEGKP